MKYCFLDDPAVYEMLDDNSLEQRRSDARVPDSIGIHDDDGSAAAHAKTRGFSTLHAIGSEQETVSLEQSREHLIQLASAMVRRTEAADTDQNVPGVRIHPRESVGRHEGSMISGLASEVLLIGATR